MENKNLNELTAQSADMQLRRLTLFSSGVGFFQHSGEVEGDATFAIPFNKNAVNDALKSIVINDPDTSPIVSYHSEDTLSKTMKGLSIDLDGNNNVAQFLNSLKGAEIEVFIPHSLKGRIMLVEYRCEWNDGADYMLEREAFLSLLTSEGIKIISLKEIKGFTFTDHKINADANRALDLIMQSRDSDIRNFTVKLPGQKRRRVSLSYVIPTPIWKVSYRLDLSQEKPFLQGWAIVDNDSDTDWDNVELALVTGKPVSFIQNLYAPYHLSRPTLPLSIAGIAKANTYDSGTPKMTIAKENSSFKRIVSSVDESPINDTAELYADEESFDDIFNILKPESKIETASGRAAGEQFEFTMKAPVSLARQQSAMLPLTEGAVQAEKMLVFSGKNAQGKLMNPAIGAELVNNTDMKLPAGAITVYDAGTYAGDALIEFFPEGEKRIISYGEDLSVVGSFAASVNRKISAVSLKGGVMFIKTKLLHKRIYTFRNASSETKRLIVEHPFSSARAALVAPLEYMEKTSELYRFELQLTQGELIFEVAEEELQASEVVLSDRLDMLYAEYITNSDISEAVLAGLRRAVELKQKIAEKNDELIGLQNRLTHLFTEQERTRKNLEAVGSGTQQGQTYLTRLAAQDNDIEKAYSEISAAEQSVKDAQQNYDKYIREMQIEN